MSPTRRPSGLNSNALQDPAIFTVVLASSRSATVVTLWGIVTSAPWMFVSFRSDASTPG